MRKYLDYFAKKVGSIDIDKVKDKAAELSTQAKKAVDDVDVQSLKKKGRDVIKKTSELSSQAKNAIDDVDLQPLKDRGRNVVEKTSELSAQAKKTVNDIDVQTIKNMGKDVLRKASDLSGKGQIKLGELKEKRKLKIYEKKKEKREKKEREKAAKIKIKEDEKARIKKEERERYESLSFIKKVIYRITQFTQMLFAGAMAVAIILIFVNILISLVVSDSAHVQSSGRDKLGNEKSISNTGGRYSEQGKSFVSKNYYEIYNTVANKSRYNSEYDIGGYCLSKTGNDEDFNLCLGIAAKALLETCKKTTEGEMICFGN